MGVVAGSCNEGSCGVAGEFAQEVIMTKLREKARLSLERSTQLKSRLVLLMKKNTVGSLDKMGTLTPTGGFGRLHY
jgi:hypothetical protein